MTFDVGECSWRFDWNFYIHRTDAIGARVRREVPRELVPQAGRGSRSRFLCVGHFACTADRAVRSS